MPNPKSGTSLPLEKDVELDHLPDALSAYSACRSFERNATGDKDRMFSRILGYLILHAPGSLALAEIVRVIHSYNEDEKALSKLGECFFNWYIRPFRKFKGRTPVSSDPLSRPQFDKIRTNLKAAIKEAPKNHSEAKDQALLRDRFRCVVTGKYDLIAYIDSLVDVQMIQASGGTVHTGLAHILPGSAYFDASDTCTNSPKKEYAASVLSVLKCFGYDVEMINGPKVHSLYNVMTMEKNVHDWFDRLEMWFECTEIENCYLVRTALPTSQVPDKVTFTSPDPSVLPYPSRQLLTLHASCAKVAHLSGAGDYIDKFDRDADNLDVLETDGSSFDVLTHAILRSTSIPVSNGTRT